MTNEELMKFINEMPPLKPINPVIFVPQKMKHPLEAALDPFIQTATQQMMEAQHAQINPDWVNAQYQGSYKINWAEVEEDFRKHGHAVLKPKPTMNAWYSTPLPLP